MLPAQCEIATKMSNNQFWFYVLYLVWCTDFQDIRYCLIFCMRLVLYVLFQDLRHILRLPYYNLQICTWSLFLEDKALHNLVDWARWLLPFRGMRLTPFQSHVQMTKLYLYTQKHLREGIFSRNRMCHLYLLMNRLSPRNYKTYFIRYISISNNNWMLVHTIW